MTNTRDDRLDSAKGILITLVVFGHSLEATSYWDDSLIRFLLTAIYAFHMPAFIFLAGVTSKPDNVVKRIAVLVSLLVIFQCLYFVYLPFMDSNKEFVWTDPFWMLWFMLAMVWWLIAITIAKFSPHLALPISLVIALVSGAIPVAQYIPALDRALYFLPWFMAGYVIGQPTFDKAATSSQTVTIAVCLASLMLASFLWYQKVGPVWLYGSNGFDVLEVSVGYGMLMRTLLILIAVIITWAMIASAGLVKNAFVKAGKRSLAIYLLHGFFILPATPWLSAAFDRYGALAASVICMIVTAIIIYTLSLSVFDKSLRALGSQSASLVLKVLQSLRKTSRSD